MEREIELYRAICEERGTDSLTDEDIARIASLLKERLCQLGDLADIGLGELVDVDANVS